MQLTLPRQCGHVCPFVVGRPVSYVFKHGLPHWQIRKCRNRALKHAELQYIQTRWHRSKSRTERGMQPRCAASNSQSNASSQSSYAWRKRLQQAKKILSFAGPALSIPLAHPAMQLMDSVIIGQVPPFSLKLPNTADIRSSTGREWSRY